MRLAVLFSAFALFFTPVPSVAHHHFADETRHGVINVVSTTGIINDIVKNVGGKKVSTTALMGPGIDPHLYRATAGDVKTLARADVVFHHGLHLEGKLSDLLNGMRARGINTVAVTDEIPKSMLLSAGVPGNYDPHVWFDPNLWSMSVRAVARTLSEIDPANSAFYSANASDYIAALSEVDGYARRKFSAIPENLRFIVTSHDAFAYFGRAYGFEVTALQGVSTASEAAISDIHRVVDVIVNNRLPAIFTESSVSPRYIKAVKEAVEYSGVLIKIGGQLYSDALGGKDSEQDTFYGMFKHNVDVIYGSLSTNTERELATAPKIQDPGL
ncbi:MAG: manganese transporter [Candidatus Mycalebacterium zealandia]|nr:MAG: manganese transporter [Candidatus Mycalebacterium zealandia]